MKRRWNFCRLQPFFYFGLGLLIGVLFPMVPILFLIALLILVFCQCGRMR